jgi:hypothetical protein
MRGEVYWSRRKVHAFLESKLQFLVDVSTLFKKESVCFQEESVSLRKGKA